LRPEVEKMLTNKSIIGHSIINDLRVMEMTEWSGFKNIIDISKYHKYQDCGKIQGLKKLTALHLNRIIQTGQHSSV
jgi:hypothetical protein